VKGFPRIVLGIHRSDCPGSEIGSFEPGNVFRILKLVLRIKRQLDHALEKLIPGNAAKISQHELLDIEPYEIAQFERLDSAARAMSQSDSVVVCVKLSKGRFGKELEKTKARGAVFPSGR